MIGHARDRSRAWHCGRRGLARRYTRGRRRGRERARLAVGHGVGSILEVDERAVGGVIGAVADVAVGFVGEDVAGRGRVLAKWRKAKVSKRGAGSISSFQRKEMEGNSDLRWGLRT